MLESLRLENFTITHRVIVSARLKVLIWLSLWAISNLYFKKLSNSTDELSTRSFTKVVLMSKKDILLKFPDCELLTFQTQGYLGLC